MADKEELKRIIASSITPYSTVHELESYRELFLGLPPIKEMLEKGLLKEDDVDFVAEVWKEVGGFYAFFPEDMNNIHLAYGNVASKRKMTTTETYQRYFNILGSMADYHNAKIKERVNSSQQV